MHYVTMIDTYMSGWGQSKQRTNALIITCETRERALQIVQAAEKRDEMKYVTYRGQRKPYYDNRRYFVTNYDAKDIRWQ